MLLQRPTLLTVELRDCPEFSLESLVSGGDGVAVEGRWFALAPHLGVEVAVDAEDLRLLQAVPTGDGVDETELQASFGAERVGRLVAAGLLIGEKAAHAEHRQRNEALRATAWWGPAAVVQSFGRWEGVDVSAVEAREGKRTLSGMIANHGAPPAAVLELSPASARRRLPPPDRTKLDDLLGARATCRNFDPAVEMPLRDFATLMHRVFGAQATQELATGAVMLKKNSPSGGGLHPIDAYVLVQRLQGVAPGLYHYHCLEHALEPMAAMTSESAAAAAHELVAGQTWFAGAPVLVLMAARFQRNFWKYRNHAKSWKVIQLDAGHLSQLFYLGATELGHGAFVTGAINDRCAERLFGLDGLSTGAVVVCGVGARADGENFEFDPLGKVER
jgi:putative peptide maturation dehydrogenase